MTPWVEAPRGKSPPVKSGERRHFGSRDMILAKFQNVEVAIWYAMSIHLILVTHT